MNWTWKLRTSVHQRALSREWKRQPTERKKTLENHTSSKGNLQDTHTTPITTTKSPQTTSFQNGQGLTKGFSEEALQIQCIDMEWSSGKPSNPQRATARPLGWLFSHACAHTRIRTQEDSKFRSGRGATYRGDHFGICTNTEPRIVHLELRECSRSTFSQF